MTGECLAVIPARGGSKGIPRKNLESVAGLPLVVRSIQAALEASSITRVIVSTEDPEIAVAARAAGAEVVERPLALAGDTATSESALVHVLQYLRESEDYEPELLVFLQCTSPLTRAADIDAAVTALQDAEADTCLSVTAFHGFLWQLRGSEAAAAGHDITVRLRRQDLPPQYLENGAVYVMRTQGFLAAGHRFFGKVTASVMPRERSVEVDAPADLMVADALARQNAALADILPDPVDALVLDFDGVFTDNRALVLEDGSEGVFVHRGDGLGLALLRDRVPILVLSTEENPVVGARCRKLGLECQQGIDDKAAFLEQWLSKQGFAPERTVFVGNDVNDIDCLRLVGCGLVVADAHPHAKRAARHVLENRGGHGALREVTEIVSAALPPLPR